MKPPKLIRVTSVLGWIESAWKEYWWRNVGFEAADKISKDSAAFGTSVHKLIEATLLGEPSNVESEEQAICASAVLEYLEAQKIIPLFGSFKDSLEIEVQDKRLGLIGHFDYAALVDGQPCIIDFKTSKEMRKSFPLQKAAYAKMANKQLKSSINTGLTIRSHWNKEEKSLDFETKMYYNLLGKYWPKFRDCLNAWKYFNRAEKQEVK